MEQFFFAAAGSSNNNISCSSFARPFSEQQKRFFRVTAPLYESKKSPYDLLGISKNATKDEVKKAFFAKAKKYHPDVCKEENAKELFAELNNAYQILKDDEKRKIYDMTGSTDAAEGNHQGGFGGGGGGGGPHGMSPEDIFNEFFRGGQNPFGGGFNPFGDFGGGGGAGFGAQGGKMPQKGRTMQRRLTVPLQDVVYGSTKQIRLQKATNCDTCSGTGEDQSKAPTTCPTCNGSGTFRQSTGFMMFQTTCQTCHGSGQLRDRCKTCKGKGHIVEWKDIEITIPAGILSGANLRVKSYGEPGVDGGPPGDLLLRVDVQNHPTFRRDRNDLEVDHEISIWTALLGGKETIHNLKGEPVEFTIPPGTQHDDKIPIRGFGIKPKNRTPGNLNVYVKVKIPRKLTDEQKELIEKCSAADKSS
eukprot:CAMPEP_0117454666 /NCGR_PEP_ID=MMETSP0759-20121206/10929_1 /TAXON_ID=63605 /ORGANISM="Percolomonas cosmopolitus, Strain WS" /LENGTH=416 /DNA_ID=CAMNT_0005247881 /DNA_START=238 /DNA_END=1488 /DNA_ORIENTATION=-